ncbi:MAG: FAD-binding protein [Chloroflexota bacterium]
MSPQVSRRSFIKTVTAGAIVVGFDPIGREWVTTAAAAPSFTHIPDLDGVLRTDAEALAKASEDFGYIISRSPMAVLEPESVQDIVKMVRFAREHHLKIAGRGQGHSTYGQPLVEAGIVIDMNKLNTIHSIDDDRAIVDAGVLWSQLLRESLPQGVTPPVLTDYIELTVGGTLAVGGIGGATHRYGLQVDNVLELEVVTGRGQLKTCSPKRNRRLFYAVLAGLGQCGIIVRATVKLIPAETNARVFILFYDDISTFTADQRRVVADGRFNYVEGQLVPDGQGGWRYFLEAASFYTPPNEPDNASLLEDLSYVVGDEAIDDRTYFDFLNRLAPTVEFLISIGAWFLPHPWFDVFIPSSQVDQYVGDIATNLTLEDTGQGPVLLYPVETKRFTVPFFRVPDEPVVFLFDILRTAPSLEVAEQMVVDNRTLFERNRDLGGFRYAIGAIPFSRRDWRQHFGRVWRAFRGNKRKFDPDNVLTPGQGIFGNH